jgi:hypothetical protein
MGRWSGVKLRVDDYVNLQYITVYRVCNQTIKTNNSLSTYTQQYMFLKNLGYDAPNPPQQILDELELNIKSIPPNDYMILGIDANKSMHNVNSNISKFAINTQLIDIYGANFEAEGIPTHINGSKQIDYILCLHNVQPFITKIHILKYYDGIIFNHRGMFCDVSHTIFTNIQSCKK